MTSEDESDAVTVVTYGGERWLAKVRVCKTCGRHRGAMYSHTNSTRPITCLCDGRPCPVCGKNRLPKPGTEVMDGHGRIWHIPWFRGMGGCPECAAKRPTVKTYDEVLMSGAGDGDTIRWLEELFVLEEPKGPYSEG
ncbi:MAG: hypothetical protein ACM3US_01205 [Sphingomonadaceae bacterium]